MEQKTDLDEYEIPFAQRTYLRNTNSSLLKKILIFSPFLFLLFSLTILRFVENMEIAFLNNIFPKTEKNQDGRVLGHLPYKEISKEKLVLIEPNIEVHIDMQDSLLKMREEARETIEENFKIYSNWMKDELKLEAELVIREGEKATEVLNQISEDKEVGVLVLGANNSSEGPGPLISQLVSRDGGNLPIPVTIVPGSMTKERIEAVS